MLSMIRHPPFVHRNRRQPDESSVSPHHNLNREQTFFRTNLIPHSPVRGDSLQQHLDAASKIIIFRSLFVAFISALVIGFVCAIFWMGNMRETMCIQDPPEHQLGGIRYFWDGSHKLGTIVQYHCSNHSSSPVVVMSRCTYKRKWEIYQINNEYCKCESPPSPTPGMFVNLSSTRIGSYVSYHCDARFQTPVVKLLQCSEKKEWVVLKSDSQSCLLDDEISFD